MGFWTGFGKILKKQSCIFLPGQTDLHQQNTGKQTPWHSAQNLRIFGRPLHSNHSWPVSIFLCVLFDTPVDKAWEKSETKNTASKWGSLNQGGVVQKLVVHHQMIIHVHVNNDDHLAFWGRLGWYQQPENQWKSGMPHIGDWSNHTMETWSPFGDGLYQPCLHWAWSIGLPGFHGFSTLSIINQSLSHHSTIIVSVLPMIPAILMWTERVWSEPLFALVAPWPRVARFPAPKPVAPSVKDGSCNCNHRSMDG